MSKNSVFGAQAAIKALASQSPVIHHSHKSFGVESAAKVLKNGAVERVVLPKALREKTSSYGVESAAKSIKNGATAHFIAPEAAAVLRERAAALRVNPVTASKTYKPLMAEEIFLPPEVMVQGVQLAANALQRQFWANSKMMVESGISPIEMIRKNPKSLVTGLSAQIVVGAAVIVSLAVAENLVPFSLTQNWSKSRS
jgi:hypothetical protein